jgi:3-methyladenine DNA glycosylase/8-oxoguanine DNA glycosylase
MASAGERLELPLRGAGGERVDLWRTLVSHGFAGLPPLRLDEEARTLELVLPLDGVAPRAVRLSAGRPAHAAVDPLGPPLRAGEREPLLAAVSHVLRLDEDLSEFYVLAESDTELSWVARGAGRMLRSPTVFEDVVKTICTTNCAWSATVRMVGALVDRLGEPAAGADGRRTFPTPEAMAEVGEEFYRDVARAGYRGAYLSALARSVADGSLDLEALSADGGSDDDVAAELLALPGVGPYAAAHIMMLLGRYSRLILDSWTRPTYARLVGARKPHADRTIERRFRRYGRFAGLAFWLFLTRDWVDERPV